MTPGTVADSIALSDAALRQDVTKRIVRAFLQVNGVVLATVLVMFVVDCAFLGFGTVKAADRLVSTNVLMSLIGATTVQLRDAILMGKYLPVEGVIILWRNEYRARDVWASRYPCRRAHSHRPACTNARADGAGQPVLAPLRAINSGNASAALAPRSTLMP